ncbi:MAG TPA: tyrosine-type recombinase/integrase [Pseudonocardiaceae bacterium]|nr:tyrosine-type recombinase/integrase [Pseudonocardiaceae bacterium]
MARTNFRDYDGVTRPVERTGRSQTAAERALKVDLQTRSRGRAGAVTRDTRLSEVADAWFKRMEQRAADGDLADSSLDTYRQLDNHILVGLGAFRIGEIDTPAVDDFLAAVRTNVGGATAKSCRSVLSGVLGHAVRRGAIATNPVREAERLAHAPQRQPRALTLVEREQWLGRLERDRTAVAKDLPDLTRFMLATGARIGEALAVSWDEIDLGTGQPSIPGTVQIVWKLSRVRGRGLLRIPRPKTEAGERLLPLPEFAVAMLRRRRRLASLDRQIVPGAAVPVFPHSSGGWRDPNNTRRDLRDARGSAEFVWVTSHVFRKTCATILDDAGLSARAIADQLGHARPSMTQDVYMGRKVVNPANADALQRALDTGSRD